MAEANGHAHMDSKGKAQRLRQNRSSDLEEQGIDNMSRHGKGTKPTKSDEGNGKVSLGERLNHVTWGNYLLTMSTGGVALLLGQQAHTFRGLETIGKIIYIWDLVLFSIISLLMLRRFIRNPPELVHSLKNPTEALLFPSFWLSVATIIADMQTYGYSATGPWLIIAIRVLFWIYVAAVLLAVIFQYFTLFFGPKLSVHEMTPAWFLPMLPPMLSGTVAAVIAQSQPDYQKMPILVAGLSMQGLGFWLALSFYAIYFTRLLENGLPSANMRPGMYIALAPPSFTILALINLSESLPAGYGFFQSHPNAVEILQAAALGFGIFVWMLAFFFFGIATLGVLTAIPTMKFQLVWWSFIFPNVGFTVATISIGRMLESNAVKWVGSAMTIVLVVMYIFNLLAEGLAIYKGQIWFPGRDEDSPN